MAQGRQVEAETLWEELTDEAGRIAQARAQADYARHCQAHGVERLAMVVVGRRRGYSGHSVCRDCYYGREWDGR